MGSPGSRKMAEDRNEAIQWARGLMQRADWVIWDTETTGIKKMDWGESYTYTAGSASSGERKKIMEYDEIIQIGITDSSGKVLLESLINPVKRKVSEEAKLIHGIDLSMLKDAPTFDKIVPRLIKVATDKVLVAYDARLEATMFLQTYTKYIELQKLADDKVTLDMQCAMVEYAKFIGEWNDYHQDYEFQILPNVSHNAIGDCLATLELIKSMASSELSEIPTSWWKKLSN